MGEQRLEHLPVARLERSADDESPVLRGARVDPRAEGVVQPLTRLAPADEDRRERSLGLRTTAIRSEEAVVVVAVPMEYELLAGNVMLEKGAERVLGWDEQRVCELVLLLLSRERRRVEGVRVPRHGREPESLVLPGDDLVRVRSVRVRHLTKA